MRPGEKRPDAKREREGTVFMSCGAKERDGKNGRRWQLKDTLFCLVWLGFSLCQGAISIYCIGMSPNKWPRVREVVLDGGRVWKDARQQG